MLDKVITYSFYLLFFLTPLFWSSLNYELFEYNKMILTYAFTVIVVGAWLLKSIKEKRLTIKRTPLDIPLLLFLGANILSTIFSMDVHTSIWGYYSRSNGGLLSLVSYLLLYWAFVSNMDLSKIKYLFWSAFASGVLISVWAILEHFGVSFSCIILHGEFNDACWIQDVQARVFATLGQPNWLAAYLAMLIFPALYFFLTAKKRFELITYYLLLITFYLAFTFTYSRGPTLGLIGGFIALLVLIFFERMREVTSKKPLLLILASFLIINLLFGSALTNFRLVSKFAAPTRPSIALPAAPTSGTQLENGGTESGQIRLIVWKGALEIFKHNPIFGSGLETFAYSYYQYRPVAHNVTSEWDFLYNKAHNEYLNYLATTGVVGFISYVIVILIFIISCLVILNSKFEILNQIIMNKFLMFKKLNHLKFIENYKLKIENSSGNGGTYLFVVAILAGYISYLVYNFFLFSVVIIAVFFYLFPAIAFVTTESVKGYSFQFSVFSWIYKRPIYTKIAKGFVIFLALYLLYAIFQLWYADTLFAKGQRASEAGNPGRAYNLLQLASSLNPSEPFYRSELAFSAAQAAASLKDTDATLSGQLKDEAVIQTEQVLKGSPKNVSYLRTAIRTYFELATIDQAYLDKTLQTLDAAIKLAPTDPKLYYNKALVLDTMGKKVEELQVLQQAIKLKPNYQEALAQLKEATASAKP